MSLRRYLVSSLRPRPGIEVPDCFRRIGLRAFELTAQLCALGPRPPGSPAHAKTIERIRRSLAQAGCEVETVEFVAQTARGATAMTNVIGRLSGAGPAVVLSGHFDTLRPDQVRDVGRRVRVWRILHRLSRTGNSAHPKFTGANDGGSSTGLLLALAEFLSQAPRAGSVWFTFFDGEEAQMAWSETDQTYGSRHQLNLWRECGDLERIRCLINLDMVGSQNLELLYELGSTPSLRDQIWSTAERLGYGRYFDRRHPSTIGDDHLPFVKAGVPAVDLIDREYGPRNGFWHTCEDDLDKLDPLSFSIVSHVLCAVLADWGVLESDQLIPS